MLGKPFGPAQFDPSGLGSLEPSRYALSNNRPLKLHNGHEDIQLQLARRIAATRIDPLTRTDQRNPMRAQFSHDLSQVRETSPQALQLETDHHVELAAPHLRHEPI